MASRSPPGSNFKSGAEICDERSLAEGWRTLGDRLSRRLWLLQSEPLCAKARRRTRLEDFGDPPIEPAGADRICKWEDYHWLTHVTPAPNFLREDLRSSSADRLCSPTIQPLLDLPHGAVPAPNGAGRSHKPSQADLAGRLPVFFSIQSSCLQQLRVRPNLTSIGSERGPLDVC
jgi:hypothetical protein